MGQGIVLRLSNILMDLVGEWHFMDSHWTPKQDSIVCRILIDNTNGEEFSALNTPEFLSYG